MAIGGMNGAAMRSTKPARADAGGFEDLPNLPGRKRPLLTLPLLDGDGADSDAPGKLLPAQLSRLPELDEAVGELIGAGHA
jgi:hypothetical protein